MLKDKRILLIISGGVAAYKSLELIRRLNDQGAVVVPILTHGGAQFVTPLSVAALAAHKVYQDLFDLNDEAEMGHIELSRSADLIVVAPATAHLMAKMAQGLADDLASTTLLATDTDILIAPSMNVRMWQHSATQRNISLLLQDNVECIGPNEGPMACGEFGPGRMAEPDEIVEAVIDKLNRATGSALNNRRILITAGPTHEPIDPVRYIANRSSGKQGFAIAEEASRQGAEVILVAGPTSLATPKGVKRINVETAVEMLRAVEKSGNFDVAIFAAAVADWGIETPAKQKLKKIKGKPNKKSKNWLTSLDFTENPDILATISQKKQNRPALVIGFAAETENIDENATAKRRRKGCDWIVANDVSAETGVMGGDFNQIHLITHNDTETWPEYSKKIVAKKLLERIAAHLSNSPDTAR
jgi:phosphopantothenoylcysteine decarboxylase / phosphopantothenate---cysteine ligase